MVIDPISDMLTRIRNAVTKKHKNVLVPSSKFKVEIAKILQNEGFINSFQIIKNGTFPSIKIDLKYDSRKSPVIKKIKRISKPGLRVYVNKNEIPDNNIDDDGNGFIDDINGWNFLGESYNETLEMTRLIRDNLNENRRYDSALKTVKSKLDDRKKNIDFYNNLILQIENA